jgi:hypothetical protein
MLFGELVLWDLPCAIWIKALRRPDSIIHHFAMAAVAFNAAWLAPVYYGVFYLGLIELSTIPLNVHEYFAHAARAAERNVSPSAASRAAVVRFRALRDGWQAAAAASFVAVRGLLFTLVSARRFFPEILPLLAPSAAGARATLLTAHHSPLATRHSPLATHHSPLATRHSPLATRYSPLTTRHSPLATHQSPITTRHSPLATRHSPLATRHSAHGLRGPLIGHAVSVLGFNVLQACNHSSARACSSPAAI